MPRVRIEWRVKIAKQDNLSYFSTLFLSPELPDCTHIPVACILKDPVTRQPVFFIRQPLNWNTMENLTSLPELRYLTPTTRERAIILANELIRQGISTKEAVSQAILSAKNWAVKNVNRPVWKRLKKMGI